MNVPASALLSINSIPKDFRILHNGISVHGLLASFLAFGGSGLDPFRTWIQTWPSRFELKNSMPLLWSPGYRTQESSHNLEASMTDITRSFPPAIRGRWNSFSKTWHAQDSSSQYMSGLLEQQKRKLHEDWDVISKIFPRKTLETFTYFWLLVNTRSFYYELPQAKKLQTRNDRMVLCPFIDYFNHNHQGVSESRCLKLIDAKFQCDVAFNENGYTVTSDRVYGMSLTYQSHITHHTDRWRIW